MRLLVRNSTHINNRSYDCVYKEHKGSKIRFTYECYNAKERCNTEIFYDYKWNQFSSMEDLGQLPMNDFYIRSEKERLTRANELFKLAEKNILTILDCE